MTDLSRRGFLASLAALSCGAMLPRLPGAPAALAPRMTVLPPPAASMAGSSSINVSFVAGEIDPAFVQAFQDGVLGEYLKRTALAPTLLRRDKELTP